MNKFDKQLKSSSKAVFSPIYSPSYYSFRDYELIHYVTDSGLPISRLVNRGRVVVKTHDFKSWVKSALSLLVILGLILLMSANFDIKNL